MVYLDIHLYGTTQLVPDNIIEGIAATWKEKGVKVLGDLCDKDTFADLTFIKELYQLPGSHFLKTFTDKELGKNGQSYKFS